MSDFLTLPRAARRLGVSPGTLKRMIAGAPASVALETPGGHIRVNVDRFCEWREPMRGTDAPDADAIYQNIYRRIMSAP